MRIQAPVQADPVRSVQLALLSLAGALLLALAAWSASESGIGAGLAFDRTRVVNGEWWRLLTGFIAHWTPLHAVANALGIAGFGWLIARREGFKIVVALMLLSLVLQLPSLFALENETGRGAEYRGASGFLYTLAVFAWLQSMLSGRWLVLMALIAVTAIAHLATAISGLSASPLLPTGVSTAWPIHIAGMASGLLGFAGVRFSARVNQTANTHHQKPGGVA